MPELPEVESAIRRLREVIAGETIERVVLTHRSLRRRLSPAQLRSLAGARVRSVERRGKHQLIHLEDGRVLHAHFRMTGDWLCDRADDPLPRFARAAITMRNGARVVLDDPRALSRLDLHPAGVTIELGLGPEPSDAALTAKSFRAALAKRRGPIKPVLLDQRVIAGLGNIYAAEALWRARIAPTAAASSLGLGDVSRLLGSIRAVIERATGARYTDASVNRLAVYDREGKPCRRCGTKIKRIVQAGRSTYFCPNCQTKTRATKRRR